MADSEVTKHIKNANAVVADCDYDVRNVLSW